jgi:hypothetical protein
MAQLGEEYPSATALELTPRTHRRFQVWGGPDYEVFLGCFDCSEYDSESIWNPYGRYGSEYSSTSINNPYSRYGSRYSPYSACNEYATQPPILWDSVLDRYAELTLNQYRPYAITDRDVLFALRGLCFD